MRTAAEATLAGPLSGLSVTWRSGTAIVFIEFLDLHMLGFLVGPAAGNRSAGVPDLIRRCRTLKFVEQLQAGEHAVWIYRTESENNYRLSFGAGRTLMASGTLMLGRARGEPALEEVAKRLLAGQEMATIFAELRGPFSILSIDPGSGEILHLTDRDGLMRCYQTCIDGALLTSTSLLLLAGLSDCTVDVQGVQEFIHGGSAVAGRTLFSDISIIPAATLSRLSDSLAPRVVLWRPKVQAGYLPETDAEIVDRMHHMFASGMDTDNLDPKKPFATDLTAGTDSRTVLSFLLKSGKQVVSSTAGPAGHVDVERAERIAKKAGIEHFWSPVENSVDFDQNALDESIEFSDCAMSPFGLLKQIPYFREKTRRFDILFGGNGGPLFKDHYWLFEWNRINRPGDPNWNRIARFSLTEGRVNDQLFVNGIDYIRHMEDMFRKNTAEVHGANNQKLDFMYFDFKCQWFAGAQFSFANKFIDSYHPMCDALLVEYSMNIRPWIRQRARLQSELIYRNHPGIAWVLTDNYVPCVPDVGWRYPLRLTRAIRYLKAARRKFEDFVLDRRNKTRDRRASTFLASLQKTGLAERVRQPAQLRLAPMLNLPEVTRLFASVADGMHSGYVQRLIAVEAIFDRVEDLRGRALRLPPI